MQKHLAQRWRLHRRRVRYALPSLRSFESVPRIGRCVSLSSVYARGDPESSRRSVRFWRKSRDQKGEGPEQLWPLVARATETTVGDQQYFSLTEMPSTPTTPTAKAENPFAEKERELTKMSDELQMVAVPANHCGVLHVYVQGNLEDRNGKTFILTCHDIGTNHKSFVRFVNHPAMNDVRNKAIFLHVCVPGQENNAPDYFGDFPTLDQIGEDMACVLDKFEVKSCIAFGEGVGANIICRFAMQFSNKINGIILVHCTSTTAGIIEYCKEKVMNLRLENDFMTDGAWDYLITHKFGASDKKERQSYVDELKATLNPKNLSKYLMAFTKRTDLSSTIGTKLDSVDVLLVSGSKASHLHTVYTTHKIMNKKKTTLLIVDNVADVMAEAPENLARSLILLCKGCGVLCGVAIPGMERQRTLSSSMEEADRPRRLSVTQPPHLPPVPSN